MSNTISSRQIDEVLQPVAGYELVFTLDTTSRSYDLGAAAATPLGLCPGITTNNKERVFVTLKAETANCYFLFANATGITIDETSAIAAAGTPALSNVRPDVIFAGSREDVLWDRGKYPILYLKGSAAGKLRVRVSSSPTLSSVLAGGG